MSIDLSGIRKTLMVLALALGLWVVGLGVFFWKTTGTITGPALPDYGKVPPFSLVNFNNLPIQLSDLQGKVSVMDFFFTTCPGPCPAMTSQMKRLQDEFKDRRGVQFVSVTVDPETDTPAVLSKYAAAVGADPSRWFFLTGSRKEIQDLANHGLYLAVGDNAPVAPANGQGTITHSTRFVLIDGRAHIRGYYDSTDNQSLQELVRAIERLPVEKTN
ncbi:MAG: SCO family protein [Terriglobia bacterium]